MGVYVTVKGWIEGGFENMGEIEKTIARAKAAGAVSDLYMKGWCHPQPINATPYYFYGGNIRIQALESIRILVEEIATINTIDGEFTDYVNGVFYVDHENEKDKWIWEVHGGKLVESRR
jgi:hypothetical protein